MKGPVDVSQELLAASVAHELVRLPRRISTAEELPDVLGLPAGCCVVVRVYDTDEGRYAVATAAGAEVHPPALARATGSREVRLASPTATSMASDFTASLVSPVGLPGGLPLLVDAALVGQEVLYAATGDGGNALKIRSRDLLALTRARVDALTAPVLVAVPIVRDGFAGMPYSGAPVLGRVAPLR